MAEYLSFEEVAAALKCSLSKVRQLVIEDKRLMATRITPNGIVLKVSVDDGPFIYDLDFCCHVSDEGKITSDIYESQSSGNTVVTKVLDVGYLRIEQACLDGFRKVPENAVTLGTAEPAKRHLLPRERDGLMNIIGGLLELLQDQRPTRAETTSQTKIIEALLAAYSDKGGISRRNLEAKFADAKRGLDRI